MGLLEDAIKNTKERFSIANSEELSQEHEVIDKYSKVFSPDHIDDLQWEEVYGFLSSKENNKHWTGLQRNRSTLENNFDKLKIALKILLDESKPIGERLRETIHAKGEFKAPGMAEALATAILTVVFPKKYAVYNGKVVEAANLIWNKKYSTEANFVVEHYEEFNKYANDLAKQHDISLWELDWVWLYITKHYKRKDKGEDTDKPTKASNYDKKLNLDRSFMYNEDPGFPRNIVLYGPVGTGKTFLATRIASGIINGSGLTLRDLRKWIKEPPSEETSKGQQIKMITMHKSYGYEQFVEGWMPEPTESGQITYKTRDGTFKEFSDKAKAGLQNDKNAKYVLILDEINRADISRVFGELITLLEQDKREQSKEKPGMKVELIYSHEQFSVPMNLYIIGTMNTTDKSIALMDLAIRRRFHFIPVEPKEDVLEKLLKDKGTPDDVKEAVRHIFEVLNREIAEFRGPDYGIGHAYFKDIGTAEDLMNSWNYKIMPLLQEYFYLDNDKLLEILKSVIKIGEGKGNNAEKIQQYHSFESSDKFLKGVLAAKNQADSKKADGEQADAEN